ncbi:MAG: translation initiation factor IF-2, partial [Bacteroidota bacterium]
MSEINTPRLMAAAKEFNIGKDTLIEFLAAKGFNRDDLKPTAKLSEDMYRSLLAEFASDKAAKQKSEQIEIPKGGMGEARKRKEEEEISFKKGGKKTIKEEKIETPSSEAVPSQT